MRDIMRMAVSCCLMKGKWPDFHGDRKCLVGSRVYSIFGFDYRLESFWLRLGLPLPLRGYQVFQFPEAQS